MHYGLQTSPQPPESLGSPAAPRIGRQAALALLPAREVPHDGDAARQLVGPDQVGASRSAPRISIASSSLSPDT
jgi:hypothetical protein